MWTFRCQSDNWMMFVSFTYELFGQFITFCMINNYLEKEYHPWDKVHTHECGNQLYLGDVGSAQDINFLTQHNIGTVITAALGMDQLSYSNTSIKHVVYPLLDSKSEDMMKYFSHFYHITEEQIQQHSVLVHCFAGISRSSTLVISYLMKKFGWSFKEAISEVRKFRPEVLPNLGFERQLKEYERVLRSEESSTRKNISKTSQSKKHHLKENKKHLGLPEIIGFGKTILPHKYLESNSLLGTQRMKLPHFEEEEEKKSMEIKNIALKSFRRRSISQHRKLLHFDKKVNQKDENLMNNRSNRVVQSINQLKISTQKTLPRPHLRLYHGL